MYIHITTCLRWFFYGEKSTLNPYSSLFTTWTFAGSCYVFTLLGTIGYIVVWWRILSEHLSILIWKAVWKMSVLRHRYIFLLQDEKYGTASSCTELLLCVFSNLNYSSLNMWIILNYTNTELYNCWLLFTFKIEFGWIMVFKTPVIFFVHVQTSVIL